MRILICGGRDYEDDGRIMQALGMLTAGQDVVIHGGARGADAIADEWAQILCLDVEVYPADWNQYGKRAGVIRNQEMLDSGIDEVWAAPGGRGTADMVRRAEAAGVPVRFLNFRQPPTHVEATNLSSTSE